MMKLVGFTCNAKPGYGPADPLTSPAGYDVDRIYKDDQSVLWVEILGRFFRYENQFGKVYTKKEWEDAHWKAVIEEMMRE